MALILVDIAQEDPVVTKSELVQIIDYVPTDASSTNALYQDDRVDLYTDLNKIASSSSASTGSASTTTPTTGVSPTTVSTVTVSQLSKFKAKDKANEAPDSAPANVQASPETLSGINKKPLPAELKSLVKKVMAIPDSELPQFVKDALPVIMNPPYNVNTAGKLAHFFGQLKVETKWELTSEKVDGYSGKRLLEGFRKRIKDIKEANSLGAGGSGARPNQIGGWPDIVYGARIRNRQGNTYKTLDGYNFRGHGLIQITFKLPYYQLLHNEYPTEGFLTDTERISTIGKWAIISALTWWKRHHGVVYMDDVTDAIINRISLCVNGGTAHRDDRIKYTYSYYNKLK